MLLFGLRMALLTIIFVGQIAAMVVAYIWWPLELMSAAVFVVGSVGPWHIPVYSILVSAFWWRTLCWRVFTVSANRCLAALVSLVGWSSRVQPHIEWMAGLIVVVAAGVFVAAVILSVLLCKEFNCGNVNMQVLFAWMGICLSLLCGLGMCTMSGRSLAVCVAGGLLLVILWSWFSLFDPEYLAQLEGAGTVLVVTGGAILSAAVSLLLVLVASRRAAISGDSKSEAKC